MVKTRIDIGPVPRALAALPGADGWSVAADAALVFVGGQVADFDGVRVASPHDIEAQTRQVFENIGKVLDGAKATWADVVRLDAFYAFDGESDDELTGYWETIARVAEEFLEGVAPAWTAVRVDSLAYPGLLIEIDAIAAVAPSPEETQ